jgi:hypothetical protein
MELYLHSPIPFMAWCLVKAQGQFYLYLYLYLHLYHSIYFEGLEKTMKNIDDRLSLG